MAAGDLRGSLSIQLASVTNPTAATGSVAVSVDDLVYAVFIQQTNLTVGTVTDNLGNTYTALQAGTDAGNVTARAYYSLVTSAGTLTSVSAVTSASANNCVFVVVAIEGPFTSSPLDANPALITSDITSPLTCPSTGTLSQSSESILAFMARDSADATVVQSPLLAGVTLASGALLRGTIGYQTVSATTAVTPAFTTSVNPAQCILGTASFKLSAGTSAISGATTLVYSATAALAGSGGLAGAAAVTFAPSAALSASGTLAGAATVTFTPAATLGQIGVLAGASPLTFSSSAAIDGGGELSGALALTFSPVADISASGLLSGASTLGFLPSADLAGPASLSGGVAITFAAAASADAAGDLVGASSIIFGTSGNLTGDDPVGQILGATGLSFTPAGTLLGSAALQGAADLIFAPVGTLGGSGSLQGVTSFNFSASAAIGVLGEVAGEGSGQILLTGSGVGQSGEDVVAVYGGFSGGIVPSVVYGRGKGIVLIRGSARGEIAAPTAAVGQAAGKAVGHAVGAYGLPITGSGAGIAAISARASGNHEPNWARYDNDLLLMAA